MLFRYYLPALENGVARSLNKRDFFSYDVLCCVWLSSGKGDFKSCLICFRCILLSSLEKELGPSFEKKLNSPFALSHENGEYLQTKKRRTTFDQKTHLSFQLT